VVTEGKVESKPNVWKERARLYNEALPKDTAEEEKMLKEALVESTKHFDEEQEFRSLLTKLDSPQ